jgi:membrane protein implicated in regulation of membrane protease activity
MDLDPTLLTWIFFAGGLLLLFIEVILPGGVAFFFGAGGLIVAGLRALGLLMDPFSAAIAWTLISVGMTIALRPIATRYFGGESSIGITDEDAETMGQTVTVLEPLSSEKTGRVRFRGAAWDARTLEGALPKGAEARIVYRDNLTWVVEPVDHSDLDQELAEAIGADAVDGIQEEDIDAATDDTSSGSASSRSRTGS